MAKSDDKFSSELRLIKFPSLDAMAEWLLAMLLAVLPRTSLEFQEKIEQGAKRYAANHRAHIPHLQQIDLDADLTKYWIWHHFR